jgi:hypothetical protein
MVVGALIMPVAPVETMAIATEGGIANLDIVHPAMTDDGGVTGDGVGVMLHQSALTNNISKMAREL